MYSSYHLVEKNPTSDVLNRDLPSQNRQGALRLGVDMGAEVQRSDAAASLVMLLGAPAVYGLAIALSGRLGPVDVAVTAAILVRSTGRRSTGCDRAGDKSTSLAGPSFEPAPGLALFTSYEAWRAQGVANPSGCGSRLGPVLSL